jgi:hypothetical protein
MAAWTRKWNNGRGHGNTYEDMETLTRTWRHGDMESWRHGVMETLALDTWKKYINGVMETLRHGDMETRPWRHKDKETWRHRNIGNGDIET